MKLQNIKNLFVAGPVVETGKHSLWDWSGTLLPAIWGDRSELNRWPSEPQSDALTYWATTTESSIGFEPMWMVLQTTSSPLGQPDFLRSLKDLNPYQNIRSVSCYPLHQETYFTSIEFFCCTSNFYTLFFYGIQSVSHYRVFRGQKLGSNHNTNFHFSSDIWNNNRVIVSFSLLCTLCLSYAISLPNAYQIVFS